MYIYYVELESILSKVDTYKRNCDSEDLNEEDKRIFDPNQFKIFGKKKQKSRSTE